MSSFREYAKTPVRDSTFVFLDDPFAYPEPEAGSLDRFRAEEGLKKLACIFSPYTGAGVDDGDRSSEFLIRPVSHLVHADSEFAAFGHCLDGVAYKV
jgi:hypothetical protein